jgi:hypothetical protein
VNAHLLFDADVADHTETEIYEMTYPNGIRGKFILTGREHFENGGPQLCAHGWSDMEPALLREIHKQIMEV